MVLDIHTHRLESVQRGCAIYNCVQNQSQPLATSTYRSLSLHPWHLTTDNMMEQFAWIKETMSSPGVVALGEAGLDKLNGAPWQLQLEAFRKVIELADAAKLPLILHSVRAAQELLYLKRLVRPTNPWILHGFRGKREAALEMLRHDIYLSFGIHYHDAALLEVPNDRLFLETDDTDIDIFAHCACVAKVRRCTAEELREQLALNSLQVFGV